MNFQAISGEIIPIHVLACLNPELPKKTNSIYETVLSGYRAQVCIEYFTIEDDEEFISDVTIFHGEDFKTLAEAKKWLSLQKTN